MADNSLIFQQLGVAPLAAAVVDATRRIVPSDQDTNVTYLDPEGTGMPVKIHNISLVPGQSVDLAEVLPEDQAKERAFKLSKNPFFKVGGSGDLQKEIEARAQKAAELDDKAHEATQKAVQEAQEQQRTGQRPTIPGVPPEYIPPQESVLETPIQRPQVGSKPPQDDVIQLGAPAPSPEEEKARQQEQDRKAEEYRKSLGEPQPSDAPDTGPEDGTAEEDLAQQARDAEDQALFDEDDLDEEPMPAPKTAAKKSAKK